MEIVNNSIPCNSSGNNQLTIKVGNEQVGQSTLRKPSGEYVTGDISNESLGGDIEGKSIRVSTMVTDINTATNWTSVTYVLNGQELETFDEEADEDNSSVLYRTLLVFS